MHTLTEKMKLVGRLQKRPEFLRVAATRKRWVSTGLILQLAPNDLQQSRFGLTITKKTYKQAVKRNRIRRRMRALAFDVLTEIKLNGTYDFVFIGKTETLERPYEDLKKDLKWCLKRLEILG